MFGLILSSIASGQIVSRTGRYKPMILGGLAILIVGMGLLTQLRVGTDDVTLAIWMFVAGLGIGPTFAVFTIVVQNAVPVQGPRRGDQRPDAVPPDRDHHRHRRRVHDLPAELHVGSAARAAHRGGRAADLAVPAGDPAARGSTPER